MSLTEAAIRAVAPGQLVKPRVELLIVTPDLAKRWLNDHNTWNRAQKPGRIERYATDMSDGNWWFTSDTIAFYWMPVPGQRWTALDRCDIDDFRENEVLASGQHRLEAIQESGRSILSTIVRGISPDAREAIDIGATRSVADSLEGPGKVLRAAIARRVILVQRGVFSDGGAGYITNAQIHDYLRRHEAATQRAVEVGQLAASARTPVAPSVIGAAYLMTAALDGGQASEYADLFWVEQVIKGHGHDGESPARALVRRLSQEVNGTKKMHPDLAWPYLISAWNHFRDGTAVSKLQRPKGGWNSGNIPFPH